jgi:hypothetical protein
MNPPAPASMKEMLSRIPASVRTALEAAFHVQVEAAYIQQLNNELATMQPRVPQLPSTPPKDEAVHPKEEAVLPAPTPAAAALAAAAKVAMAWTSPVASIPITPIKKEQTVPRRALFKRKSPDGKTQEDCIDVDDDPDPDENPKQADPPLLRGDHGLQIIDASDINRHLVLSKSDLQVVQITPVPNTPKEQYRNGIHFLATVLTITEATSEVMNLLPGLHNLSHQKDVRPTDVIGFLTNIARHSASSTCHAYCRCRPAETAHVNWAK